MAEPDDGVAKARGRPAPSSPLLSAELRGVTPTPKPGKPLHAHPLRAQTLGKDCRQLQPLLAPPRAQPDQTPATEKPAGLWTEGAALLRPPRLYPGSRQPARREERAAAAPGRGLCESSSRRSRTEPSKAELGRAEPSPAEPSVSVRLSPGLTEWIRLVPNRAESG